MLTMSTMNEEVLVRINRRLRQDETRRDRLDEMRDLKKRMESDDELNEGE
jgi:hypothetical protein